MEGTKIRVFILVAALVIVAGAGLWYFLVVPKEQQSQNSPVSVPPAIEEGKFFGTNVSVTAAAGEFSPSEVTVNAGDGVIFSFTAVDTDYDLLIKLPEEVYMAAKKGKTVLAAFVAQKGIYEFACRNFCPGGKEMVGKLIVR